MDSHSTGRIRVSSRVRVMVIFRAREEDDEAHHYSGRMTGATYFHTHTHVQGRVDVI